MITPWKNIIFSGIVLKKYNILKKEYIKSNILKTFWCDKRYLKTKIKSYEGKINASFHDDRMPKVGAHFVYISLIWINYVFEIGKNYHPQVFL